MVTVAPPASPQLETKALAAAGQFRAIALWLNEPLIPQGVYVQVQPDPRPGCLLLMVEFKRPPHPTRLTQYLCHLVWQLNSPLIEGVHIVARRIGTSQPLWEHRVRVLTPALKAHWQQRRSQMPPVIAPPRPDSAVPALSLAQRLKTLRALMLTGSAVAAFVFGCMVEVVLSARQEPALPFQPRPAVEAEAEADFPWWQASPSVVESATASPPPAPVVLTRTTDTSHPVAVPISDVGGASDRPKVVEGALEPVGVIQHERLSRPQDPTLTLVFGGTVDLDDLPYSQYQQDRQLLAGVPHYRAADVAMVNLEDPLATAATSLEEEFIQQQRPEAIQLLKAGGVDIVNLANTETLAYGASGLAETLQTLDTHGIYRVGAGRSEHEARRPEILEVKGQRIAYLSYDRQGDRPAHETAAGTNAPPKQAIIQDIQAIRDDVDWLIVNYRWTDELSPDPADSQTNLARLAIDQGADVVIGYHAHQLQGAEIYKGRPIAYSLGELVAGQPIADGPTETAVLQVSLRAGKMKVDLVPVRVTNGHPQRVDGAAAAAILNKIQQASQQFEQPLPPSIVLDARSAKRSPAPATAEPAAAPETFIDQQQPATSPAETTPITAPAAEKGEEGVGDALEIEPIPAELLENWGPKDAPGTVSVPESSLPEEDSALRSPATSPPAPTLEASEDAIAPYSEPLVGPLSARPTPPPAAQEPAPPTAPSLVQWASPPTRIWPPRRATQAPPTKATVKTAQKLPTAVLSAELDVNR